MKTKKSKSNDVYENRIVAFIDILGFSSIVKKSERDHSIIKKINNALNYLKKLENPKGWNLDTIEIEEDSQKRGVETFSIDDKTNVTCFSDSIIVSVNIEHIGVNEALSTLIANISYIGSYLLTEDILFRGGISIGNLIHSENGVVFGQGLIDAYELEKSVSVFPRIILSKILLDKLNYPLTTKKDRYPYHQYLVRFDDGCVGFHQLQFFQVVQSWIEMNEDRLKINLKKAKKIIVNGLDENLDKPEIYKKFNWLKNQYNSLVIIGGNIKEPIHELNENIGGMNIHFSYTDDFLMKNTRIKDR